jgi:hypothetical protein
MLPWFSQVGSEYTFTVRDPSTVKGIAFGVSYDAFIDDVQARLHMSKAGRWCGKWCPTLAVWRPIICSASAISDIEAHRLDNIRGGCLPSRDLHSPLSYTHSIGQLDS